MFSEGSVHGQLGPRQKHHGRRTWWRKVDYLLVARKQKERQRLRKRKREELRRERGRGEGTLLVTCFLSLALLPTAPQL